MERDTTILLYSWSFLGANQVGLGSAEDQIQDFTNVLYLLSSSPASICIFVINIEKLSYFRYSYFDNLS